MGKNGLSVLEKTRQEIRDIRLLLQKKSVTVAITKLWGLDEVYANYKFQEKLSAIDSDFKMMKKYWKEGVEDNQRAAMYAKIVDDLDHLLCDMEMERMKCNLAFFKDCRRRIATSGVDFTLTEIKARLEAFVSDFAMTELLSGDKKEKKLKEIHASHQKYLDLIFDYILSIGDMSKLDAEGWTDILISPTIDTADRQLLIMALAINLQNVPQVSKMQCMIDIYNRAEDDYSQQPALIGWTLALHHNALVIDSKVKEDIENILNIPKCIVELFSLQLQIFMAMNAEKDSKTLDMEMNRMRMSSEYRKIADSLEGNDVDHSLDDVLNAGENNAEVDEWVETLGKLSDMRKKGADLFFGGFSQLKNMSFFSKPSNWFVNFYMEHPDIESSLNVHPNMSKFLKLFTAMPMLPTDKYSFVMMSAKMARRLPPEILKKAFDDFSFDSNIAEIEEKIKDLSIRDAMTKLLYRFYKLFGQRECFDNPMEAKDSYDMPYLFITNPALTSLLATNDVLAICKNMYKMGRKDEIVYLCKAWKQLGFHELSTDDGFDFLYFWGAFCNEMIGSEFEDTHTTYDFLDYSIHSLELAHQLRPETESVNKRLISVYYLGGEFEKVYELAKDLVQKYPDDQDLLSKYAVSSFHCGEKEKSEQIFYKLLYLYPDNNDAIYHMPQMLMQLNKYEQTEKMVRGWIEKGLDEENAILYKDMALLEYHKGNIAESVEWFAKYYTSDEWNDYLDDMDANNDDSQVLEIRQNLYINLDIRTIDDVCLNLFVGCIADRIEEIKLEKAASDEGGE